MATRLKRLNHKTREAKQTRHLHEEKRKPDVARDPRDMSPRMAEAGSDVCKGQHVEGHTADAANSGYNDYTNEEGQVLYGVRMRPEEPPHEFTLIGDAEVPHRAAGRKVPESRTKEREQQHDRPEH